MRPEIINTLTGQLFGLFVLAIPIACIVRTVVFEEIFKEPREWCKCRSESCRRLMQRKFFYLFTCEYCFSHWVTLAVVAVTRYRLLLNDWRGSLVAFFSLVFVANVYLNLYGRIRLEIQREKAEIKSIEHTVDAATPQKTLDTKAA